MAARPDRPSGIRGYALVSQTVMELVVPIVAGVLLDQRMGWTPWATLAGVLLGVGTSMTHLLVTAVRVNQPRPPDREPAGDPDRSD